MIKTKSDGLTAPAKANDCARELTETPYLQALSRNALEELLAEGETLRLARGESLFRFGQAYPHKVYILCQGQVRIEHRSGAKRTLQPGEFIGISNYLDETPYRANATAQDETTVLAVAAERFARLEARHGSLRAVLDRQLSERIRERHRTSGIAGILNTSVATLMTAPIVGCGTETPVRDAVSLMRERRVNSLVVRQSDGVPVGFLTYPRLAQALALDSLGPHTPVESCMTALPPRILPDAPLWQADTLLQQNAQKYLLVHDDRNALGILSQSDILRALGTQQTSFHNQTQTAQDLPTLARFYRELPGIARSLHEHNRLATRTVQQLSEYHLAIQRRCVELTLEQLDSAPPRDYALIIMGSGGRHEMLLNPDQDNGLIIDDSTGALTDTEQRWFSTFADRLNINLDKIGYVLCPGDIMARNPSYQKTLSDWQRQFDRITRVPNNKAARWANIMMDFSTLYGDEHLTNTLYQYALQRFAEYRLLLEYMAADDAEGSPAIGWFNRLVTSESDEHKGKVDVKRKGIRIIVDGARIYAISASITARNTENRLNALVRENILQAELVDAVKAAHEQLLDMLLAHQLRQYELNQPLDKYIDPDKLDATTLSGLRASMRAVKRFQDQMQGHFGREAF
jgi:CBS domain-containing protein